MSDPSITEDTDALRAQRREFVREHRTAVFGYPRQGHGPSMSIVYYVVAGDDELRVSSMRDRSKTKSVRRDGKVTLCVLDEQWPMSYLQVYCDAEVDDDIDGAVDQMMADLGDHGRRADARVGAARRRGDVPPRAPRRAEAAPLRDVPDAAAARAQGRRPQGPHALDQHEPAMVRRNWFSTTRRPRSRRSSTSCTAPPRRLARAVRGRLRTEYGFYVADHVLDAGSMTHGDFDDLVHRGRIRIVDDPAEGVAIETGDDEAFWSQEDGTIAVRDRDGARCWFPSEA